MSDTRLRDEARRVRRRIAARERASLWVAFAASYGFIILAVIGLGVGAIWRLF